MEKLSSNEFRNASDESNPPTPSKLITLVLIGIGALVLSFASCPRTASTVQLICALTGAATVLAAAIHHFGWTAVRNAMKLIVGSVKRLTAPVRAAMKRVRDAIKRRRGK